MSVFIWSIMILIKKKQTKKQFQSKSFTCKQTYIYILSYITYITITIFFFYCALLSCNLLTNSLLIIDALWGFITKFYMYASPSICGVTSID